MPTSSMAAAAKNGTLLHTKVLGRAPSAGRKTNKENTVGSVPSFPGAPKEPNKDHQRGPGRPPASSLGETAPPAEEDESPLEPTSWGASDPAIRAQLERELGAIRRFSPQLMRERRSESRLVGRLPGPSMDC